MANHAVGTAADKQVTVQKLDAIGWGLFFIWIGIALLANLWLGHRSPRRWYPHARWASGSEVYGPES